MRTSEGKELTYTVRARLLSREWLPVPPTTLSEMRDAAIGLLGIEGIVDIDARGVIYKWSRPEHKGFTQPDVIISDVAALFHTAFHPYLVTGYCNKLKSWGSYGVKHDIEEVFRKARHTPDCTLGPYVSNGYGIMGYLHYLLNVRRVPEGKVKTYFAAQYGCGDMPLDFNLNMRMPECYGRTIEYIHRGR